MPNTIPIASLRAFAASSIKPNPLLPVTAYLRLDFDPGGLAKLTKNNGHAFIAMMLPADGIGSFLIDEKILFGFLDQAETDSIQVSVQGNNILLQSGSAKCVSPTEPVDHYLRNEMPDEDGIPIPQELAQEIATAAAFIQDLQGDDPITPKALVFVGKDHVAACDGMVGYFSPAAGAPQLILRREVAVALGALGACTHVANASYDFFQTADTMMGFIKSELGFCDVYKFSQHTAPEAFRCNKQALIKFNAWAMSQAVSKIMTASWVVNGAMRLEWTDPTYDRQGDLTIAGIKGAGEFNYLPALMNQALRGVPGDEVVFYQAEGKYYLSDLARTYTALVMECAAVVQEGDKTEKK
jgi:hypothetical protein